MKEAFIHPGLRVEIVDNPIPVPNKDQVVIRVICSGCNPTDWKGPERANKPLNQGHDITGFVFSVGEDVTEFKPGDRVAALHELETPHGAWAEYAVSGAHTTFHLPKGISFEEAATVPLAAMTAAIGLYLSLGLPAPWSPATKPIPLLVYGASGAVGSFVIKLAQLSNIHPIIAVAGKAKEHVETLISREKKDTIVDYRQDDSSLISELKKAIGETPEGKVSYAFDCISEKAKRSYPNILQVLDPEGHITLLLDYEIDEMPTTMDHTRITVFWAHRNMLSHPRVSEAQKKMGSPHKFVGAQDFAFIMFRFFGRALQSKSLSCHPYEIIPGGLYGLEKALAQLKAEKASAVKYVLQIPDTDERGRQIIKKSGI